MTGISINLFLAKDAMTSIIKEVLEEKEAYGTTTYGQGTKYNVEFVSANPTGDRVFRHAAAAAAIVFAELRAPLAMMRPRTLSITMQ